MFRNQRQRKMLAPRKETQSKTIIPSISQFRKIIPPQILQPLLHLLLPSPPKNRLPLAKTTHPPSSAAVAPEQPARSSRSRTSVSRPVRGVRPAPPRPGRWHLLGSEIPKPSPDLDQSKRVLGLRDLPEDGPVIYQP